ncbi:hypothetical protein RHMOL_Rhmol04G0086300 [Rhododendron molle]|uniref:Uncharacterized protein n=1 Tax=Rhododendron molle TaxID=49168 RepID=A0ACC0P0V2_RHOML|nr:hypothetical protein RHMOL_Rhmol04G0086300 [Rhododendron molle]
MGQPPLTSPSHLQPATLLHHAAFSLPSLLLRPSHQFGSSIHCLHLSRPTFPPSPPPPPLPDLPSHIPPPRFFFILCGSGLIASLLVKTDFTPMFQESLSEEILNRPIEFSMPSLRQVKLINFAGSLLQLNFVKLLIEQQVVLEEIIAVKKNGESAQFCR